VKTFLNYSQIVSLSGKVSKSLGGLSYYKSELFIQEEFNLDPKFCGGRKSVDRDIYALLIFISMYYEISSKANIPANLKIFTTQNDRTRRCGRLGVSLR
jgi:hypothetical protein